MDKVRGIKLKRNSKLLFFIVALFNMGIVTLISTVFYTFRGLSPSEIFYTAVVFALVTLLAEIPSSYLADKWGRKKTIMLALIFGMFSYIIQVYSYTLFSFSFAFVSMAISYAFFSGTDEALIYDSNKELGFEESSLGEMGRFFSAKRVFKIVTPIIAVLIAKDLSNFQFVIIHLIQIFAIFIALILAFFLTEAKHFESLTEDEAKVFLNAFSLIKKDKDMKIAIFSKSLIFISSFVVWRYYQQYFLDIGLSILMLGIFTNIWQLGSFIFVRNISNFKNGFSLKARMNLLNIICLINGLLTIFSVYIIKNPYIIAMFVCLIFFFESIRTPVYSEFFNKKSQSFNRATTISLTNLITNLFNFFILFLTANIVNFNINSIFLISVSLILFVNLFFRFKKD